MCEDALGASIAMIARQMSITSSAGAMQSSSHTLAERGHERLPLIVVIARCLCEVAMSRPV